MTSTSDASALSPFKISSIVSRWSRSPCQSSGRKIGSLIAPRQPCFTVHKAQTRLPLSTAEINRGFTASSVRVSYQL